MTTTRNSTPGGILYGVGVGPGDPALLPLKAHRLISAADVLAYPAPDDAASFARSIVADTIAAGTREIRIEVPMRTERFPAQDVYDRSAHEIGETLSAGQDVLVLCEGDPFFYGSFMYLFERLAGEHAVEIVPGVSSLTACAAMLQRPLAARNDMLSVIPAPLEESVLKERLQQADAAAIIKVGRHLPKVRRCLVALGLLERAAYVERATLPNMKTCALADVTAESVPYFSMILLYAGGEKWGEQMGQEDRHE